MTKAQIIVKGLNLPQVNDWEIRQIEIQCLKCENEWIEQMTNGYTLTHYEKDGSIRMGEEFIECPKCFSRVLKFK